MCPALAFAIVFQLETGAQAGKRRKRTDVRIEMCSNGGEGRMYGKDARMEANRLRGKSEEENEVK